MAIDNMISVEFTEQELTRLGNALNEIAQVFSGKVINLTPEERKQYGSIADKTIDKHEFDKDYKARQQMEEPLRKLLQLAEMLSDTKILLDFDNYNGSLSYYRYVKFLATQNTPGITSIYEDLSQHFQSMGKKAKKASDAPEAPKNPQGE